MIFPVWLSSVSILLQGADARTVYSDCRKYTELSRALYRKLQAEAPDSPFALTLKAEARRQRDATAEADELLRRAGTVPDASCERGTVACAYANSRFAEAAQAGQADRSPEALYWAARAGKHLADTACAALHDLPDSADLHAVQAKDLAGQGKYREAVAEWRAAIHLAPEDRTLPRELASALFLSEDYKGVLPELRRLQAAEPGSANLQFFVGDSLMETEALAEALPYLQTAVRLDARLLPAQVALGFCLSRLNRPKDAIPHLKAGLPLDRDGSVSYQLSRAYQVTHQLALAKEMMERSQALRSKAAAPPQ